MNAMNITLNGKTVTLTDGQMIIVSNYGVFADGKAIFMETTSGTKVIIHGDVGKIECSGSVEVHGNAGSIHCSSFCTVEGDVKGDIKCGGACTCGNVSGDIDAGGSVSCRR